MVPLLETGGERMKGCVDADRSQKMPGAIRLARLLLGLRPRAASFRSSGGTCGLVVRPRFRNPNPRSPGHYTPELPEVASRQQYVTAGVKNRILPLLAIVMSKTPSGEDWEHIVNNNPTVKHYFP